MLLLFFFFLTFIYLFIWLPQILVQYSEPGIFHLHWMEACGIYFPDQMLNPDPMHWELGVLAAGPPGKSHSGYFLTLKHSPVSWCHSAYSEG